MDAWMDKMINEAGINQHDMVDDEPYAKLELFFWQPPISWSKCPDVIAYWGVSILLISDFKAKFIYI